MADPGAVDLPADVQSAVDEVHHALTELAAGNAEPTRKTYWHADHTTLFGAYGGYDVGWPALSRRLDAITPLVAGRGSRDGVEVQTLAAATGDLAYTVELERRRESGQDTSTVQTLRVTQIYRRVQGTWKLVHRHADPLSDIHDALAETGWKQRLPG
ncbi:DUF4440 domain-containing protein [Pseudonocardiaceae bacterium YIM PH 21723]|nr:DUF4440 domain-containing protein [Pseudonocardiaceae bacterium YIM PH 21723]